MKNKNYPDNLPIYLSTEDLKKILQLLSKAPPSITIDEEFLMYGLSIEVLRHLFGLSWTNKTCFSFIKNISSAQNQAKIFLKTTALEKNDQFCHQHRVVRLAETTFNLQKFEGFDERIKLGQNHDLESAYAEMECASLLAKPELELRFVKPSGVKGQDYDCEVVTSKNRVVCCEIKSKSEKSILGKKTIYNLIENARKQLPKDKPSIILIRLPEKWQKNDNIQPLIQETIQKIYRQSNRIVAIFFSWEEWEVIDNAHWILGKYSHHINYHSNFCGDDLEELISMINPMNNSSWINFQIFVKKFMETYKAFESSE